MRTGGHTLARRPRKFLVRALASAAALALLATACSTSGEAEPTPVPAQPIAAAALPTDDAGFLHRPVYREAPGFTLTDVSGQPVSLSDFAGKWVLVDWIFLNCVTFCPLLTDDMAAMRAGLGDAYGTEAQLVSITFDPDRDTPRALAARANAAGGGSGWSWLTGDKADTDAVAAAYGVSYEVAEPLNGIAQFDHTAQMVVIDPDGRERHRYFGTGWSEEALERLLAEMGGAETEAPPAPVAQQIVASGGAVALLAEALAMPWEEWELAPGVSSQSLYQFASSGQRYSFVDQFLEDATAQGASVRPRSSLSAMTYHLVDWSGGRVTAVGYTDGNIVVIVEAESIAAATTALNQLDDEWCCSAP